MTPWRDKRNFKGLEEAHRVVFGFLAPLFVQITLGRISLSGNIEAELLEHVQYSYCFPQGSSSIAIKSRAKSIFIRKTRTEIVLSLHPGVISGAFLGFSELIDLKRPVERERHLDIEILASGLSKNFTHLNLCFVDKYGCKVRYPLTDHCRGENGNRKSYRFKFQDRTAEGECFNQNGSRPCEFDFEKVKEIGFEYICEYYLKGPDEETRLTLEKLTIE